MTRPRRPPPKPTRHRRTRARRHTAAPAPAVSRLAIIEIEERHGKGAVERRVLSLPLLGHRGSQLELHDGQLDDELGLHIDSSDKQYAALSLSLDRHRFADKGKSTRVRLGVSQRLTLGRRTLMTGVDLSGGGRLEVYATVR